jgi:hypothetical protein
VLRPYIRHAGWWVPITGLAVLLGWAVAFAVGIMLTLFFGMAVTIVGTAAVGVAVLAGFLVGPGAIAGLVVGTLQGLLLERSGLRPGWWVVASAIGGICLSPVAGAMFGFLRPIPVLFGPFTGPVDAAGGAACGAAYGAVTGIVLGRLLDHSLAKR